MKVSLDMFNTKTGKWITGIVILFILFLIFVRTSGQVNKPHTIGLVMPGGTCTVDQRATQVSVTEKPWEVGADVFGGRFDSKDFYGMRFGLKYKF